CFSKYIPETLLKYHFDPRENPRETHLLCALKWGETGRIWSHWVRNYSFHAERYFLRNIFEGRRSSHVNCYITWYLSWSPCAHCCDEIQQFLERHPYVSIDIRVARLFRFKNEEVRECLIDLCYLDNISVLASFSPDYIYCWNKFIRGNAVDDTWTVGFEPHISMYRSLLRRAFKVSRS
ncbi:ABEC1 enzyme, partial [Alectura lathami]|nr:ABEC1 enzyme [Alectura lathami]